MLKKIIFVVLSLLVFNLSETLGKDTLSSIPNENVCCEEADAVISNTPSSPYLDVFQMIQGKVAGVWVTGSYMSYTIRVRGSHRPPMIVIDGLPFRGYDNLQINDLLFSLHPNDVDRIQVIKNIAQAAIYGNSGSGVIVIHTKRGRIEEEE